MQIVNYVTTALNEGMYCIAVFLDLKKAFDVCSHSILLAKLNKMGIQGTALEWFKNYLSGRSQKVEINGTLSDPLDLDISVIQGSILGPILFLCYINDFWTITSLFSVLFADDTTGLGKGKNLRYLTAFVNTELQKIANWFRANKMAINVAKTKFIVFRTRGKVINPLDCQLVYNSNEIGLLENQAYIRLKEFIMKEKQKILNCLEYYLMSTCHLMITLLVFAPKYRSPCSVLIELKNL